MSTRRLVLAGAGHAHLDLLAALRHAPLPGWDIRLVVPHPEFQYSGMLPAVIAGHAAAADAAIPVARIAAGAGITVTLASVTALDSADRSLRLSNGEEVGYDLLSLDVGSVAAAQAVEGVAEFAFPVRPFPMALRLIAALDAHLQRSARGTEVPVVVAGAGAAGVEIACALRARILAAGARPHITMVDATAADGMPLAGFRDAFRRRTAAALAARGITVQRGTVVEVRAGSVRLAADESEMVLPSVCTAWVTGAAAHPWLITAGLDTDTRGFPLVRDTLALVGHPEIFGGGDCVTLGEHPRTPKAGVYAVRMAPVLAANVLAAVAGTPARRSYVPQPDFLALLSTGDGRALLRWRGVALEAAWAQRLKDRIDHGYLDRYRALAD